MNSVVFRAGFSDNQVRKLVLSLASESADKNLRKAITYQ